MDSSQLELHFQETLSAVGDLLLGAEESYERKEKTMSQRQIDEMIANFQLIIQEKDDQILYLENQLEQLTSTVEEDKKSIHQ